MRVAGSNLVIRSKQSWVGGSLERASDPGPPHFNPLQAHLNPLRTAPSLIFAAATEEPCHSRLWAILVAARLSSASMERPTKFETHRYVGDKRTQIVYDVDETVDESSITELLESEQFISFSPDTLAEARNRGYRTAKR